MDGMAYSDVFAVYADKAAADRDCSAAASTAGNGIGSSSGSGSGFSLSLDKGVEEMVVHMGLSALRSVHFE